MIFAHSPGPVFSSFRATAIDQDAPGSTRNAYKSCRESRDLSNDTSFVQIRPPGPKLRPIHSCSRGNIQVFNFFSTKTGDFGRGALHYPSPPWVEVKIFKRRYLSRYWCYPLAVKRNRKARRRSNFHLPMSLS